MNPIPKFIVAGVIVSSIPSHSVVLMGNIKPTRAMHEGQVIDDLRVFAITRKWVDFKRKGELVRIMVGDGFPDLKPEIESHDTPQGRLTYMTQAYRDDQLSALTMARTFMQAGVKPIQIGDQTFYEIRFIEEGSIFDVVGLKNDDLIMSVNGYDLGDTTSAIRTLIALKTSDSWLIEVLRGSDRITLHIKLSN